MMKETSKAKIMRAIKAEPIRMIKTELRELQDYVSDHGKVTSSHDHVARAVLEGTIRIWRQVKLLEEKK